MTDSVPSMRSSSVRPRRTKAVLVAVGVAGLCAVALGAPQAVGTVPAAQIDDKVNQADDDLASANQKVNRVKEQLAQAEKKIAPAEAKLAKAQSDVEKARQQAAAAQESLDAAEAAVAAVQVEIKKLEAEIAELRSQIGALARVIYTSGGQYEEVQILFDSKDPAQFAERLASLRRVSQGNSKTLDASGRRPTAARCQAGPKQTTRGASRAIAR